MLKRQTYDFAHSNNVNEWISAMKRLLPNAEYNELYYRRMFYYINFIFRRNQSKKYLLDLDKKDIANFIGNRYWTEKNSLYADIKNTLKTKLY